MPHPEPGRREHAPAGTSLLAGLTPEQAQAVTYSVGPLLLIAGPGVWETRTAGATGPRARRSGGTPTRCYPQSITSGGSEGG
jgi:hypothetical protein